MRIELWTDSDEYVIATEYSAFCHCLFDFELPLSFLKRMLNRSGQYSGGAMAAISTRCVESLRPSHLDYGAIIAAPLRHALAGTITLLPRHRAAEGTCVRNYGIPASLRLFLLLTCRFAASSEFD